MEVIKDKYSITELSERLHITDHALRYYEKEFNFPIPRDDRGRRYYTPEFANIMYQITSMRNEGLAIKAIQKILQSENIISDHPPVVQKNNILPSINLQKAQISNEFKEFFNELERQITDEVTQQVSCAKDNIIKEINKSKLELGACVENSSRKLETKLEKHFNNVDRMLGIWREKNRHGFLKKVIKKGG